MILYGTRGGSGGPGCTCDGCHVRRRAICWVLALSLHTLTHLCTLSSKSQAEIHSLHFYPPRPQNNLCPLPALLIKQNAPSSRVLIWKTRRVRSSRIMRAVLESAEEVWGIYPKNPQREQQLNEWFIIYSKVFHSLPPSFTCCSLSLSDLPRSTPEIIYTVSQIRSWKLFMVLFWFQRLSRSVWVFVFWSCMLEIKQALSDSGDWQWSQSRKCRPLNWFMSPLSRRLINKASWRDCGKLERPEHCSSVWFSSRPLIYTHWRVTSCPAQ